MVSVFVAFVFIYFIFLCYLFGPLFDENTKFLVSRTSLEVKGKKWGGLGEKLVRRVMQRKQHKLFRCSTYLVLTLKDGDEIY